MMMSNPNLNSLLHKVLQSLYLKGFQSKKTVLNSQKLKNCCIKPINSISILGDNNVI